MKKALIVFAKKPEAGKVKTRLVPPLSYEEAKELYLCFIKDALTQYAQLSKELNFEIFLAVTPETSSVYFEKLAGSINEIEKINVEITVMTQTGQDLGTRIFNAFTSIFSGKYAEAVVIGTDHPTLPDEHIRQCFTALDQQMWNAVLGPAEDGGYYLIGLKHVRIEYFKDICWSTNKVFDQSLNNLRDTGNTVYLLPKWYDVDDRNSLSRMIREIPQNDQGRFPFYSKQYLHTLKNVGV
jgi:rSAM/selenodomain-associated transferase 1